MPRRRRLALESLESRQLLATTAASPNVSLNPPVVQAIPAQSIAEDTVASLLLSISDGDTPLDDIEIEASSTNPKLIPTKRITWRRVGEQFRLDLSPQPNQSGNAQVTIRASDGLFVTYRSFPLTVLPVNDAPTSVDFDQVAIHETDDRIEIDLFAAFDDVETPDRQLVFSVDAMPDSNLVESLVIDSANGLLRIEKTPDARGELDIFVRATDTEGASSLLGGVRDPVPIYVALGGKVGVDRPDTRSLRLKNVHLLTSWAFFRIVDGKYRFDDFREKQFSNVLQMPGIVSPDRPVVLNIENDFYVNSPTGRERWAEVLRVANEVRPELDIGVYRYLPERNWHSAVRLHRAQQDIQRNVNTGYLNNAESLEVRYLNWLMRNNEFRTDSSVTDALDHVNPSLYTFYRDFRKDSVWVQAKPDVSTGTFRTDDLSFADVRTVHFRTSVGSKLPPELRSGRRYYIVNNNGHQWQVSGFPDGQPIRFSNPGSGDIYVAQHGSGRNLNHDANVVDWHVYAKSNIQEARKLGLPVNAWLAPSLKGNGEEYLEYDFFKTQLQTVAPLVDSITLFNKPNPNVVGVQQWWAALTDFVEEQKAAVKPLTIQLGDEVDVLPNNLDPLSRTSSTLPTDDASTVRARETEVDAALSDGAAAEVNAAANLRSYRFASLLP